MTNDAEQTNTVYIIGAGASHAVCGFPLLAGFLKDCRTDIEARANLHEYLERRFSGNGHDALDANLEDVLADLDNTLFGLGQVWYGSASHPERLRAQIIRSQLLEVIQKRLSVGDESEESSAELRGNYERVLGKLTGADTVITFNYDRSLDYCCGMRPLAYVMNPDINYLTPEELAAEDKPWLLHLHGSIDFLTCGNVECPNSWRILGRRKSSGTRICGTCGADMEIAIVPPSMTKSFQRYPLLSVLARIAKERLVTAKRIVIWGFSCPSTDHHVGWLLRSCRGGSPDSESLRRIDVIDPDAKTVLDRFKVLLAPGQTTECRSFGGHEEYVSKHLSDSPPHA